MTPDLDMFNDILGYCSVALALIIVVAVIQGCADDYRRANPGKPGWGIWFFAVLAIGWLVYYI